MLAAKSDQDSTFRSSNLLLAHARLTNLRAEEGEVMSVDRTTLRGLVLLFVVYFGILVSWGLSMDRPFLLVLITAGLLGACGYVLFERPDLGAILALPCSGLSGVLLGLTSASVDFWEAAVFYQAIVASTCVAICVFGLSFTPLAKRLIPFGIISTILGLLLFSASSSVTGALGIQTPPGFNQLPLAIPSVVLGAASSFVFMVHLITLREAADCGVSKRNEWYLAISLTTALFWIVPELIIFIYQYFQKQESTKES